MTRHHSGRKSSRESVPGSPVRLESDETKEVTATAILSLYSDPTIENGCVVDIQWTRGNSFLFMDLCCIISTRLLDAEALKSG
jgi:hypothetical protein